MLLPTLRSGLLTAGPSGLNCKNYGREKKSILQKSGLMFSITYGRKNAGFLIFSQNLCSIGQDADALSIFILYSGSWLLAPFFNDLNP
jgi:hypothetical protein